jgi:sporulation protein YlmC with PRC-barrel domain
MFLSTDARVVQGKDQTWQGEDTVAGEERYRELEEKYEGYKVYDNAGESIGKVDDLFVDEQDREEYIGVKMGLFGLSGTTLIPMEIARINERERVIEVAESKERVKDAPQYKDDDEIDLGFEARIRQHFDLGSSGGGGSYDRPTDATGSEGGAAGDNTMRGDEPETSGGGSGENVGREEYRNDQNYVSDSVMASAAGGAATSGGVSDFETGDREGTGGSREGERQDYYQEYQDDRQGEGSSTGDEGAQGGGEGSGGEGAGDDRYRDAYLEGYRQAIRDSSGQGNGGSSDSMASGEEQGGRTGDREGTGEFVGATPGGSGEEDYGSASTGHQQSSGREDAEGEGRTRVRRLRRDY